MHTHGGGTLCTHTMGEAVCTHTMGEVGSRGVPQVTGRLFLWFLWDTRTTGDGQAP